MPTLGVLRYTDAIVRRRYDRGDYNGVGRWVPGEPAAAAMRASVQPVALEDVDRQGEGGQLRERVLVYVPASSGDLRAASDTTQADEVVHAGAVYVVEQSRTWPGSHTRALLIRTDAAARSDTESCEALPAAPDSNGRLWE